MSLNPKANCDGFATGWRKFYFFPVWCRKPEKVGKHCIKRLGNTALTIAIAILVEFHRFIAADTYKIFC